MNPANALFDFGARSGATGSFTSVNGSSVTVVANGSGQPTRLPDASFGKSVPVRVARSLSSGHLNLSQPAGSCASAEAEHSLHDAVILLAHDLVRQPDP